jgi:hypothetical protein
MKLLEKREPSAAEKPAKPKKRRIITVIEAIEETPPSTSVPKTVAAEATNLENTLFVIDEMILNMAKEETAAVPKETPTAVPEKREKMPGKEKKPAEDASEEGNFNFQNIIGQELSKAEKRAEGLCHILRVPARGAAL